jgi:hypothetical protein
MSIEQSIENLYNVFSIYKAPKRIKNFDCNSCVSEIAEQVFLTQPLNELNESIFGLYFEACNVGKFPTVEHKYFIPRLLELSSVESVPESFSFSEYFYECFSFFDYQNTFIEKEIIAINDFFCAFLEREFFAKNADQDSHSIIHVAQAGFNTIPFLDKLKMEFEVFVETKEEIELYIEWKKQTGESLHYSNFEEWANMGEIHQMIHYLSEN